VRLGIVQFRSHQALKASATKVYSTNADPTARSATRTDTSADENDVRRAHLESSWSGINNLGVPPASDPSLEGRHRLDVAKKMERMSEKSLYIRDSEGER
jgi:hypothetical protein